MADLTTAPAGAVPFAAPTTPTAPVVATAKPAATAPPAAAKVAPPPDKYAVEVARYQYFHANMPIHNQGDQNSCGTTSFSMDLATLGIPGDFRLIDRSCRMFGSGSGGATSPADVTAYMRRAGLQAHQYTHCDFSDIEDNFRAGHVVQVLIDYTPERGEEGNAHYVNVIGIQRDDKHNPTGVAIMNPWGREEVIPYDMFIHAWMHVGVTDSGLMDYVGLASSTMMVYDRPEANPALAMPSLVSMLRSGATDGMLSGITGFSAGWQTMITRGHWIAGPLQEVGAVVNTVFGGVGFAIGNLGGTNAKYLGKHLLMEGAEATFRDKNAGFFSKLGAGFEWFAGFVLYYLIGWPLNMVGGGIGMIGEGIATVFNLPANEMNRGQEMQEMLLNTDRSAGVEDPAVVVKRASTWTKISMMHDLLTSYGGGRAKDQEAAMVVLNSCDAKEMQKIAAEFGGAKAFVGRFSGANAKQITALMSPAAHSAPGVVAAINAA